MTIAEKIEAIQKKFYPLTSNDKYNLLMEMGQKLPAYPLHLKIEEHRVKGCQSTLYFYAQLIDGKLFFIADSDALISKGLAALLIEVYSGHTPAEILASSPKFLQEMGIFQSLSPTRSNGLAQLNTKMRLISLKSSAGK